MNRTIIILALTLTACGAKQETVSHPKPQAAPTSVPESYTVATHPGEQPLSLPTANHPRLTGLR